MSTVTQYLEDRRIDFRTFDHERAQTATDEARKLGVAPGAVAKTLVLRSTRGYALAVIPAGRRIAMKRAQNELHARHVRLASEEEILAAFPAYELGAIPPLGSLLGVPVYIDCELVEHESILFASGRQDQSIKMHLGDLLRDKGSIVACLCDEPSPYGIALE